MRRVHPFSLALSLLTLPLGPAIPAQETRSLHDRIEVARSRVYPALVNIAVVSRAFRDGRTVRNPSAGSGTIISPQGHVITNYHVARDATSLLCTLISGEQIPADLVGEDPATDLSVLKLRLAERKDPTAPLATAALTDSDRLQVGDIVLAMGNPLTLSSSMTLGIVSNTRRVFTDFRGNEMQELAFDAGPQTGMFTLWIQHDALILPGNSGGPLVDLEGRIVGVNTRAGSGVGFASPANLVRKVIDQILAHGRVQRGYIGVSFLPTAKLGRSDGALVSAIRPGSPGEQAGLRPGDMLLSLAGKPVVCRFLEEVPLLFDAIADIPAGTKVEAVFLRDGVEQRAELSVAAMDDQIGEEREYPNLGLTAQQITEQMAFVRRMPDTDGALITGMRQGFPFEEAKPGVAAGDVVLRIGKTPIKSLSDFTQALEEAGSGEVAIVFRRDLEIMVTMVELKKDDRKPPGGELAKPWLGVRTQVLTPKVAEALQIPGRKGFRITQVYPWTKAAAAGFQEGDVLLAMEGSPLAAWRPQDARDLQNRIEERSIGEEVTFQVLRGQETLELRVDLEETPTPSKEAKTAENKELEFKVRDITFMDKIGRRWERDQRGVLVTEVANGGWASLAGLTPGDLVCTIDGAPVEDVKSFEKQLGEALARKPRVLPLFVRRGYRTTFVFIEPDWARAEGQSKKG